MTVCHTTATQLHALNVDKVVVTHNGIWPEDNFMSLSRTLKDFH